MWFLILSTVRENVCKGFGAADDIKTRRKIRFSVAFRTIMKVAVGSGVSVGGTGVAVAENLV
jgi:hypothetical protein